MTDTIRDMKVVEPEPCFLCGERAGIVPDRAPTGKLILRCKGCQEVVGWEEPVAQENA